MSSDLNFFTVHTIDIACNMKILGKYEGEKKGKNEKQQIKM
jgi:hypothetical protein